ncbi:MAG: nuclear transport factor 2 family protein [Burkholderia sp.]
MSAEANKAIVTAMYDAYARSDAKGHFGHMSDDVKVTYFGSHRFSRTYHGKQDLFTNFIPHFVERLDGPIDFRVKNIIAADHCVAVEAQGTGRTKDGQEYNNFYCIVLRLENGKVTEIREYMDTELTKRIFG